MKLTDLFIRRPVLATVVNLLILLLGLRALDLLEVRQYPQMKNTVVTVTTTYPGASSELVKGFVTTPLQQAIAEAAGIDYMFSTSRQGVSTIQVNMVLDYDPNAAVSEIQAKVASKRNVLPAEVEDPVIDSTTGDATALMYLAFYSREIPRPRLTDYIIRVVQPSLQALPGVAKARLFGQEFAMRIWLDPVRMSALDVTASEVEAVLRANNYLAGIGGTKDSYVAIDLKATTDLSSPEDFESLVIRERDGALVRLRDIARTELGAESYDSSAWYKGIPAVFIGIEPAPGANPLEVARRVNGAIPGIRTQLPQGMHATVPYDASRFIQDSIDEVYRTLAEAVAIVLLVIFLTLGSVRAALVPAVTVPLSMIGAAFIMLVLGYSLNLLTLLAMVLAIGLVVDDAIVVVENVHRHIEMGMSRIDAALAGARELALPIIAMTTTLVAVYAPIGFMGGLVGTLFTEFAFTLAGAVVISGVVALTLSPVLSSRVLRERDAPGWFEHFVDRLFRLLASGYRRLLHSLLNTPSVLVIFGLALLVSIGFMFTTSQRELAPTEDQSILFFQAQGPRTATLDYHRAYTRRIQELFQQFPEYNDSFYLLGRTDADTVFGGFKMKPVSERSRSQMELQPQLQAVLDTVAGYRIAAFPRPSIPGASRGLPIQFVLISDRDYSELATLADELIGQAMASGNFQFLKKSIALDRPTITIDIDRDRAGDLGISMAEIGRSLGTLLGEGQVNRFSLDGRSYRVIPQVERRFRRDARELEDYYLRSASGELVPLANLVTLRRAVEPANRPQFQQLNALTIQGVMAPGIPLGDALEWLQQRAEQDLPRGVSYDYMGESRQYAQQGSALLVTFFLSLLVIYLVLAGQFESWRDPLIILVAVPLAIAGAMAFITLGYATINIYTQVGLITLIGVVAKNGILIVEFANQQQIKGGLSRREAVEAAATIRLRPILMTSVSLVVAMIPLLTASGPGAVSRYSIGLTVASGLGIGTFFTLFVLPAFYLLLARDHSADRRREAA